MHRNSDMLLYTGLHNTFGTQLVQMISFGLPIVTLDQREVPTFVSGNAGTEADLDGERTAEDVKQALMVLFFAPDQRTVLGLNACYYAQQPTWTAKVVEVGQVCPQSTLKFAQRMTRN